MEILEKLDFDFDLEFNIVEFGEVQFFLLDFEFDSVDFDKVGYFSLIWNLIWSLVC